MSVPVVPVQLRRTENSQPWGFRLRGGSDQGIPLHVEHVSTLHTRVNSINSSHLSHDTDSVLYCCVVSLRSMSR